jgi:integrase
VLVREQLYEGERKRLKSGSGRREVPLSQGLAARLLVHRRDTYAGPESPVLASRTGTPLQPSNVWRQTLEPTREAVGMPWVTFHSFRHTCASLLFEKGRNVKQVSEWLGHADPAFTLRRYVHLMDAGLGDADFLDAAVSADPARFGPR